MSPFPHMVFIAFLIALRAPSSALRLRRAFRNDEPEGFSQIIESDLLALRGYAPDVLSILLLRTRRDLRSGCITSRPFFCTMSAPLADNL